MAFDPVCGVPVNEQSAQPEEEYTTEYNGEKFYFCSEDCKRIFEEMPPNYVHNAA
jgi:YHS domain-containing protein